MKRNFTLVLFPDGEIEICGTLEDGVCCSSVYHKSYNPDESIKDNLNKAFEEWCRLNEEYV